MTKSVQSSNSLFPILYKYKMFFKILDRIEYGNLQLTTPEGKILEFKGKNKGISANIILRSWNAIDYIINRRDIGFAEGYIDMLWDTNNLPELATFASMNLASVEKLLQGKLFYNFIFLIHDIFSRNTKRGSRHNISTHYDLGNDFYELWLDKSMTYSSALFNGNRSKSLEEAQLAKYQRILDKIDAKPSESILEIGCGWGAFAEFAAKAGLNITAITISKEQAKFAKERIHSEGLDDKANIELVDYRIENRKFDHIVSIGMFEHVGEKYWSSYFKKVRSCLRKNGNAIIQTIVIDEKYFAQYKKSSDFIRQYIFPGGMLPSKERFVKAAEESGLKVEEIFTFGKDYAITLEKWLERFDEHLNNVIAMGFPESFIRKWRCYLSYCIAAFATERTSVMQAKLLNI